MNSFLCRVMVLVFLVNCLTPSLGWGQTSRRRNNSRSLGTQVERKAAQAEKQNTPGYAFAKADTAARDEHNKMFAQADQQARANQAQLVEQKIKQDGTQVNGSTRFVRPAMAIPLGPSNAKNFLSKVANDEIPFDKLIDYADPMNPAVEKNDLLTSTYATEIIGNTVSQLATLQDQDLTEFYGMLPQIESRLLYRMMLLGFSTPSYTANPQKDPMSVARLKLQESITKDSLQKTIAVGTLRLALLKINQFYQAKGKMDPADDYQARLIASQLRKKPTVVRTIPEERKNTLTTGVGKANEAAIQKQAATAVKKNGNLADFQRRFLQELRQAKNSEPKQGTGDFYNLQLLAEYATAYTLEYAPNQLRDIVKIFDEGVEHNLRGEIKPGDYQRDFAPILNAIFSTIFENTRYSAMSDAKTKQVLNLLVEFSDPEKYSLPTRVFALEAASLLYRPFNEQTLTAKQPAFATFSPLNLNQPDEKLRQVFAQRVVALYCPLKNESVFGVQDYGLDSKQMQTLADKLAYIYDGFYDISTTVISMPGKDPHQHTNQCVMTMKNQPNRAKKNAEDADDFFWWTANTAFFIFGGDVFQLLGTAFRLTRGAVAALPKAHKAFRMAANGQKVAAFNKTVHNGAKAMNFVNKAKNDGLIIEFTTQKISSVEEVGAEGAQAAQLMEPGVQLANSARQLTGKRFILNPKRWTGKRSFDEVTGMAVTDIRTGERAVADFTQNPFKGGLRSWEDIESAWSQLRLPDGSAMRMPRNWSWRNALDVSKARTKYSYTEGLTSSLADATDQFFPLIKKPLPNARIAGAAKQGAATGQEIRYWNLSWGDLPKPTGPYTYEISDWTQVFVAPKTYRFTGLNSAARLQAQAEGGVLKSQLPPGFFTSKAEIEAGKLADETFDTFFRTLEHKNIFAKTFLPDYIPTKTFWQFVKESPTVFGTRMLPKLFLYRNRLVNTTAFFAAWYGLDFVVHPVVNWWLTNEQQKDVNKELAKYGDAFDPKRAKADELLRLNMGDNVSDQHDMHNSYPDVTGNLREQRDGASLTAVIVGTGRALGMKFVDDATNAYLARTAHQSDFVHAQVRQMHIRMEQNKKINEANDKFFKEQRQEIGKAKQQMLAMYADGFAALPKAKEQLVRLYDNYANEFETAAFSEQDSKRLNQRFDKQLEAILTEVALWDGALKQAKQDVAYFKKTYKDYPGVFTAREQKLVVSAYTDYVKSSAADDKRLDDLQAKLQLLAISLFESAQEKYPEKQAELEKMILGEK
ncbi:MAG: hypothetical protein J6Y17_00380 [Elusimicrobiaceae bacterium]|nr:hypothetical protein [Elusimicrobiaceae bacterium]